MKLIFHKGEIRTNFYNNKIPKEGSQSICLSVVSINFFLDQVEISIPKWFQKNLSMLLNKKKIPEYITDKIEIQLVEKLREYRRNYNITYNSFWAALKTF